MTTLTLATPSADVLDRPDEVFVRRRVQIVWALLVFNVLSYAELPMIVPIQHTVGKLLTQGALVVALLLALTVNRRLVVRPNIFLMLVSILVASSLMITIRGEVSVIGSDYRVVRFIVFVLILWLLTPWWGRSDLFLARLNIRCMVVILCSVLLGLAISPHKARQAGRLEGSIWPIPPTQVAHYAAEVAGLSVIMWLAGVMSRRVAGVLFVGALGILLLTHTRTALVAMTVAILLSSISLFAWRRRVRKVLLAGLVVAVVVGALASPFLITWLSRGESSQELTDLSGRTIVWSALVHAPRSTGEMLFGFGLSNNAFNGLPIDNSWLATYQDQGLFGDAICGAILLFLLLLACSRPRSPARAMALYLIIYCTIASFTETGLGGATTYLLDLTVAASLLAAEMTFGPPTRDDDLYQPHIDPALPVTRMND